METTKNVNILFSSIGRRVELVQLAKKALIDSKNKGKIIGIDIDKNAPALYFCDESYIVPECDNDEFIENIIQICNENEVSLIIPTIDTELPFLSRNKDYIESKTNAILMISDKRVIETFYDKRMTNKFFKEIGIITPKIYNKIEEINDFPVIAKPITGSASTGIIKVMNKPELVFIKDRKDYIIQECINGDEITIDVLYDFKGNIISIGMRKRIRIRGGEVQIGETLFNNDILENIKIISKHLDFKGGVTFQAFTNDKGVFFIECNPRFGGGLPFTIIAGANFIKYLIMLLDNKNPSIILGKDYKQGLIFSRYDQSIVIDDD